MLRERVHQNLIKSNYNTLMVLHDKLVFLMLLFLSLSLINGCDFSDNNTVFNNDYKVQTTCTDTVKQDDSIVILNDSHFFFDMDTSLLEFVKCFYENGLIHRICINNNNLNFDSLIDNLCKFVPYSVSEMYAGEGKIIYMITCWDSSSIKSNFFLFFEDKRYCRTIGTLFESITYNSEFFNRDMLLNEHGVRFVVVAIYGNAFPLGEVITDITLEIEIADTTDVKFLIVDLKDERCIECVDSNIIVYDHPGNRAIMHMCYPKYDNACN